MSWCHLIWDTRFSTYRLFVWFKYAPKIGTFVITIKCYKNWNGKVAMTLSRKRTIVTFCIYHMYVKKYFANLCACDFLRLDSANTLNVYLSSLIENSLHTQHVIMLTVRYAWIYHIPNVLVHWCVCVRLCVLSINRSFFIIS